jgi:prepilin-type N-terminal cleavage/methylation domain-containing protein
MSKKALTLVEVIVSMVIFALIMAGLANLFVATKRLTLHSHSRMMLGELGRYFLDPLQMDVDQSEWVGSDYTNDLRLRENDQGESVQLDGVDYTPTYTVKEPPGFDPNPTQMRKVKIVVSYPASAYE